MMITFSLDRDIMKVYMLITYVELESDLSRVRLESHLILSANQLFKEILPQT